MVDMSLPPNSPPLLLAIQAGIIDQDTTVFDWKDDPPARDVDVINLGDPLNLITSSTECQELLTQAWSLTRQVLIVSAPVGINHQGDHQIVYGNGEFRHPHCFRKYYQQEELKNYLEQVLNVPAIPVSLGVYFIFRSIARSQKFLFSYRQSSPPQSSLRDDILIYLALYQPNFSDLIPEIQNPIIALFNSYEQASQMAQDLLNQIHDFTIIVNHCQQSPIGKLLPGALYIHVSALPYLHPLLRLYQAYSSQNIGIIENTTLIKFNTNRPQLSYLFYPDFDREPHPILKASIQLDTQTRNLRYRDYKNSDNPPLLHRKETFVTPDYPHYQEFAQLTQAQEKLGLLNHRGIGTLKGWLGCLEVKGVDLDGHQIVRRENQGIAIAIPKIERHKAAMLRNDLSRPMRLALETGIFTENTTFFDYGCGHGGDIARIAEKGYLSRGWDPYYLPDHPCISADVVNLGYVINVIECTTERRAALIKAWELTQQVLIVSAQVLIHERGSNSQATYGDGIITRRRTFQKYYEQEELKTYIDQVLNVDAVPIALGIYLVFRNEEQKTNFTLSRLRCRVTTPRIRANIKRFEDYQELLTPLMRFVTERGRLPVKDELVNEADLKVEFSSFKRAFQVILQVTDQSEWDAIARKRREDLLVYFALSNFSHDVDIRNLALEVKNDIKCLFGSFKQIWEEADQLLFTLADKNAIAAACAKSKIGLKLPRSFSVHISALSEIDPLIRLYEGCASRTIGRFDGANLIKFHIHQPRISYLFYPHFDTDPHPVLANSVHIDLQNLHVSYCDYDDVDDPPIFHRKETVVAPDYPNYEKFAKLSLQEENWGLFDDFSAIKTRRGWLRCLEEHCAEIHNYRLFWRKDADPYRIKLAQSARRSRRKSQLHTSEKI